MISQALKQSETRRETDLKMFYARYRRYVKSNLRFRLFTKFSDIAFYDLTVHDAKCILEEFYGLMMQHLLWTICF